jgi:hypothetical protein
MLCLLRVSLLPCSTKQLRWFSVETTPLHLIHQKFKPFENKIESLNLHLEMNPAKLDEYTHQGLISEHTSKFFKAEILQKQKSIRK